jgi:hypothetical protein
MPVIPYDPSREALYRPEIRPTLFRPGDDPPLTRLAMEAARLAYHRAERSDIARQRLEEALARVGFGSPELFFDRRYATGTFGFGARRARDGCTLIAFRVTPHDDLRDLVTDLRFPPTAWEETGGRVHKGFANAVRSVIPQVHDWLQRSGAPAASIVLCGHGLGAAVATLAAALLRPALLVTLGSPRVGDADFVHSVAMIPGLRVVDCTDIVTRVPPPELGYRHVRPATYITAAGEVREGPAEGTMEADGLRAKAAYPLRHGWRSTNVLQRSFADHAPINYLRAFFR